MNADLTIIIPSYNRGKYIREALDSIFMQETDYLYKVVIADDCSTDSTVEIVKEYQSKYPNEIEFLPSDRHLGLFDNTLRLYSKLTSPYFCVLDPDDYWTDKFKIQKALDFLEQNKEYTIYVTNTMQKMPDGSITKLYNNPAQDSDFQNYLNGNAVLGCTLGGTFRNVVFNKGVPDKLLKISDKDIKEVFCGDSFRNAIHIYYGKAHSVTDYDAVYRITNDGNWQGLKQLRRDILQGIFYLELYEYLDRKHPELLKYSSLYLKKIKSDLPTLIYAYTDADELKKDLSGLIKLENALKQKQKILDTVLVKKQKTKYKILFSLYRMIEKKLIKKGLV